MPSLEERREIAARLRELYPDDVLPPSSQVRIDICYTIGCGFGQEHQGEKIHKRLADLIEPEERTCRIEVHGLERDRQVGTVSYTCSECGKHIGRDDAYCKYCGAKVVEA